MSSKGDGFKPILFFFDQCVHKGNFLVQITLVQSLLAPIEELISHKGLGDTVFR